MNRLRIGKRERETEDAWLLTYGDMFTLLVTFFVIIIAVSSVDEAKYEMVAKSMSQAMDKKKVQHISIDSLIQDVKEAIAHEQMEAVVEVDVNPRGVAVSAKGSMLFPSGSARLKTTAMPMLNSLARLINQTPYNIAVEGHTDNVPISDALAERYPTNWELSSARASSVVRHFIEQGVEAARLSAVGFADTRPLVSNATAEGRARNRRVIIIFLVFKD